MPSVRTIPFSASGQLVGILGKKLINENSVAVLELIKNAYDADATKVTIKFSQLSQPAETRIVVQDNGEGMTADEVESDWMTAGISPKRQQAIQKHRTGRGRVLLGEMGIGRFATQRLGNSLVLVTRKVGHPEVTLRVNWDEFEYADRLEDVECKLVEEDSPHIFLGDSAGTRVVMSGSTDTPWSEAEVEAVSLKVRRLLMPGAQPEDFSITLEVPEFPKYERLGTAASLDKFHFALSGHVDDDGVGTFEVVTDVRTRTSDFITVNLWNRIDHVPSTPPRCGAFDLNLRVFMKQASELRLKGVKPNDVKELSGVSVFRDGFRVLPYGDPGDDWLQLDKRRINDMARKFGNEQIIGFVSISAENNLELLDQANRLGLQKNASYLDFSRLIVQALTELEKRSYEARQTIIVRRTTKTQPIPILHLQDIDPRSRVITEQMDTAPSYSPVSSDESDPELVGVVNDTNHEQRFTQTQSDPRVNILEAVTTRVGTVIESSTEQAVLTYLGQALDSLGKAIDAIAPSGT